MNIAFLLITFASIVAMIIKSPESAFPTMIDGVGQAITLIIKLTAIYAVWLSVLDMMTKTKLDKKLSKLLKPVARKIFKNESEEAYDWICINLSANMLHQGNERNGRRQHKGNGQYDYAPCNQRHVHTTYTRNSGCDASLARLSKRVGYNGANPNIERYRNALRYDNMQGFITQKTDK